jgi:hypothetical protein
MISTPTFCAAAAKAVAAPVSIDVQTSARKIIFDGFMKSSPEHSIRCSVPTQTNSEHFSSDNYFFMISQCPFLLGATQM